VNAPDSAALTARISELTDRFMLPATATEKLTLLAACLIGDPLAPTSVHGLVDVVDRHLADSLVALELEPIRSARQVLDLGSGAGLPGLPLAAALPGATFVLLESVGRKCAFIERTATTSGISNVQVVNGRAESFDEGFGRYEVVTARAVAPLNVTVEYAAPLLRLGGQFVAWGGKRSPEVETVVERAADAVGLGEIQIHQVKPFAGAQSRHLYVMSKVRTTPPGFPRRPGIALKRPLGRGD
jgi:16S rRNA (guanine527-N7)-methyltransferase